MDENDCQVTCKIQSQWDSGCIVEVTLYNSSDENIEDWSMQFTLADKIDNIWRATAEPGDGNAYSVKNCGYNAVIPPEGSETFGMQLSFTQGNTVHEPQDISVTQFKRESGTWNLTRSGTAP